MKLRHLLLGRTALTNLDSVLKSRDITLPTRICLVKAIGEGNGNPLQYSCLENPVDGGAWWAAVPRVTSYLNHFENYVPKICVCMHVLSRFSRI